MTPRPYRTGQRQAAATEQTRTKILTAAGELLTGDKGPGAFSMEAVARQAGVARMTVYYQFESRTGLLESLFDDLAARGGMGGVRDVFASAADARTALAKFIAVFAGFYSSARTALRRLRGLAVIDADLEETLRNRGERRRVGLRTLIDRLTAETGAETTPDERDELCLMLFTLTSFETFDLLCDPGSNAEQAASRMERMVFVLLDEWLPAHA